MYKLKTSANTSDELSVRFNRERGKKQQELTNNKTIKKFYHYRITLKDVFGFAEQQEKLLTD